MTEVLPKIINYILGAGFIGSILTTFYVISENRRINRENKLFSRLQSQLNNLYAPLNYLVLENERTIELYNKYHKEYGKRFMGRNWSQDKDTQEKLQNEASELIKAGNDLINSFVIANNKKIINIIEEQSAYIDNEDQKIFTEFKQHYERLSTEFSKDGKLRIPLETYTNLGGVSYFLPSFAKIIKEKYQEKINAFNSILNK